MKSLILLPILVFAAAACTTNKFDRLRDYRSDDQGFAVVSVGVETDSTFSGSFVLFRRKGSDDHGNFFFSPRAWGQPKANFRGKNGEGLVQSRALPPGQYEVYSVGGARQEGPNGVNYPAQFAPFSFTVQAGRSVYLGRYVVTTATTFGPPRAVSVILTDEEEYDLKAARQAAPSLPAAFTAKALPLVSPKQE